MPKTPSAAPALATTRLKRHHSMKSSANASKSPTPPKRNSLRWINSTPKSSHIITYGGKVYNFSVDDDVIILGCDMENTREYKCHEFWVGRIKDIRTDKFDEVWALIQWYWSGDDVREKYKRLDTSSFGQYERSRSADDDVVNILCLNGHAKVVKYNDDSLDQVPIDKETFYWRRMFDFTEHPPTLFPPPKQHCDCERSYNPDTSGVMYFCPNLLCKKWWHSTCLDKNFATHPDCNLESHQEELINSSLNLDVQLMERLASHSPHQRAILRKKISLTTPMLSHLPNDIINTAKQQIRRGGPFGIVGNVRMVTRARQFIARCYGSNRWKSDASILQQVRELQKEIGNDKQLASREPFIPYYCPDCADAI